MRVIKLSVYILFAFISALALLYLIACSDSDETISRRETQFNIGITDVPCSDMFSSVNVTFSSFVIQKVNEQGEPIGDPQQLDPGTPITVDLLEYDNGTAFIIHFPGEVEAGTYVMVSATITGVVVESTTLDQAQVDMINLMLDQRMPITSQFLGEPRTFTVNENGETTVIIDVSCNDSMMERSGVYSFEPSMTVINVIYR